MIIKILKKAVKKPTFNRIFKRKKKELDEYDRQQGERWSKIFESATEFILNLLAKTNRRFTEYEIHQRLVNTTFLDSGTLRDGKLVENGPTGSEMQQNVTQANVGQDRDTDFATAISSTVEVVFEISQHI